MIETLCHNQSGNEAMSGEIEIETGLTGYLDKDAAVVETSRKEWEPEYNALSRLIDIFRRMSQLVVVKEESLSLPSQLFLVVLNQSYGVTSELLRRRTTDAQLKRREWPIDCGGIQSLHKFLTRPIPTSTMITILNSLDHRISTVRNLAPLRCFLATVQLSKHWEASTNCSVLVHHMLG